MSSVVLRGCVVLSALLAGAAALAAAQTVTPGTREIWQFNFASLPVGDFPVRRDLSSNSSLEVVDKNGVHMLKAGMGADFVIALPETLPETFTLEFDLVPQESGSSDNLSFKGTREKTKSPSSAEVFWSPALHRVVGGGDPDFQATTSNLGQTLAGQLSHIVVSIEGTTIKLYTNNVRLYTVDDRRFARGQLLRVSLGGTDDGKGAVYLARVRVAEGAATTSVIAQRSAATGIISPAEVSTIRPAGGTAPATVATQPVIAPASTGAVAVDPVLTTPMAGRSSAILVTTLTPKTVTLSGFTATGTFVTLPPKTVSPNGFTAVGTFVTLPARTVTLQGWTAVGVPPAL